MKIVFSELLKDALEYFPKIIFCDNMELRGNDGAFIPYLNSFYFDLLSPKLVQKDYYINCIDGVAWSINSGFWKKAIQIYKKHGKCKFVHQKDLDTKYIMKQFKENMKNQSWQEFLKKENIEIIYDIE